MEKNILRFKWMFVLMIVSMLFLGIVSADLTHIIKNDNKNINGVTVKASEKLIENCFIDITGNEKTRHVKLKENEFDIKYNPNNPSVFVLDENCELGEGTKFVTQKGNYNLRGYEAALPEDSDVNYEKEKVVASVVSGTKITPPVVKDRSKVRGTIEIKTKDTGALITSRGKFQAVEKIAEGENAGKYKSKQTSIFYVYENNKLKSYSKDGTIVFLNNNNQVDFAVFNPNAGKENSKFYFLFERQGNQFPSDANYLLVTDKEIASISSDNGVVINLGPENRLGVKDIAPNQRTLSFQGKNGVALLEKSDNQREIPVLTISGNSIYGPDKKSFFLNDGKLYYADYPTIALGNHGDSTPYLRLVVKGNKENPFGFEIFTNNQNQHVAVKKGALKSSLQYFQGSKGSLVSNTVVFNELSPEAQRTFVGLPENEQNQLIQGGISSDEVVTTGRTSRGTNPTTTRRNGGGAGLETRLKQIRTQGSGAEGGIYRLTNDYRTKSGLSGLRWSPALTRKAKEWSQLMATTYGYQHSRMGYGENIHQIMSSSPMTDEEVIRRLMVRDERFNIPGWWNSQGHRNNILGGYSQIGVGVYHYVDSSGTHHYLGTQLFYLWNSLIYGIL